MRWCCSLEACTLLYSLQNPGSLCKRMVQTSTPFSAPVPQVKRAEDDLLAARRANTALRADKAKLDETISTLQLENDMVARQVGGGVLSRARRASIQAHYTAPRC